MEQHTMEQHNYAGFWIRVAATIVDAFILIAITLPALTLIYGIGIWSDDSAPFYRGFWDAFFSYALPIIFYVFFWVKFGATPGKMLFKLKIIDANSGNNISIAKALGRYFAQILSILPLLLGYIWVGIDKKKRSFHDILAGTIVIKNTK